MRETPLTLLDEVEAVVQIALEAGKQESALLFGLIVVTLMIGDFGSELDPATKDAVLVDVALTAKVVAGVGLAGMSGEWAASLTHVVREGELEVVVPVGILAQFRVVLEGGDVDGSTCIARQPASAQS